MFVHNYIKFLILYHHLGYGHISPATKTGKAVTIVYAIFGIPILLILLADLGKWFTRSIKMKWAYVRRLYYTGSLRRVRKQTQVQVTKYRIHFLILCHSYSIRFFYFIGSSTRNEYSL